MDLSDLLRKSGLRLEPLPDGRHRIFVQPEASCPGASDAWTTAYPPELVYEIHAAKGPYVCDEIRREEDPRYVEHAIRHEMLGYVEPDEFAGKRVLDFGCGAGASTLVMSRLLPSCSLIGIELQERLVHLARLRAEHLGRPWLRFLVSARGDAIPQGLGSFDYIVLSAVYEHLLPHERPQLIPRLWRSLRPGGVLFVNQTPHRYSPVEMHTTGLPLINYLPDALAFRAAKRFSRRLKGEESWPDLLRAGIRGATIREVLAMLGSGAELMKPRRGDLIDLWHGKLSRRHAVLKKTIWTALKLLKPVGGIHLVPELTLAIRKLA